MQNAIKNVLSELQVRCILICLAHYPHLPATLPKFMLPTSVSQIHTHERQKCPITNTQLNNIWLTNVKGEFMNYYYEYYYYHYYYYYYYCKKEWCLEVGPQRANTRNNSNESNFRIYCSTRLVILKWMKTSPPQFPVQLEHVFYVVLKCYILDTCATLRAAHNSFPFMINPFINNCHYIISIHFLQKCS